MAEARMVGKALIFNHFSHGKQFSCLSAGAQPPESGLFRSSHEGPQQVQGLLTGAERSSEVLVVRGAITVEGT